MANPKLTLLAGTNPIEGGANGFFSITLDSPAPAGGLTINFDTTGSTSTFGADYNLMTGTNVSNITANSFKIAAGATTATLNLVALADTVTDANETVSVNLTTGTGYDLATTMFATHSDFTTGAAPYCITVADFNGDGNADLTTANTLSKNISVLLGNGRGSFAAGTDFAVGSTPTSITVADFNGDGNTDLATANAGDDNVSVLLGNGSGNFSTPTNFAVGDIPFFVTTADFDGDGNADLAVANANSDNVSVLLGNGNGGFAIRANFAVGSTPAEITVADFNGDGNADLATTNIDAKGLGTSNISVLLGNGNGGFAASTNFTVGSGTTVALTAADFNGDGNADLAVSSSNINVSVLLGNGRGGFAASTNLTVGSGVTEALTAADFNGDGNADLITATGNDISVLLGNGRGSFAASTDFVVGSSPTSITITDFNGDGNADLATANYTGDNISVLLNITPTTSATLTIANVVPAANHTPTGEVTINDTTPETAQTLTVSNTLADADGLGVITYLWQASGVNIGTGNSYTLTSNEIGKTITATAKYTDGLGKKESVSSARTVAVTNTETAGITITGTDLSTNEQGDTAIFNVKLNSAPTRDVTLAFASSDTSEGVISNSTLKFTSANWSTVQTFTVTGQNDSLVDGDIAYSINAKLTTLDIFYKSVTTNSLTLTNQDTPVAKVETIAGTNSMDVLQGTSAPSYLLGEAADDDLSGGAGNDTIYGSYGNDLLFGEDDNDVLYGEQDADYLDGGAGNDILDGGLGLDTLIGGAGNDTYYLGYDAMDVITDNGLATDIDTIIMPYQLSKYTLPTGIEQGTIAAGTQTSSLTGNTGDNNLTGNAGKNTLIGAVGRDSLFGGDGNDVLVGGTGNDMLSGGTGKDIFKFNTAPTANIDNVTDFNLVDDTVQLDNAFFAKLGANGVLNAGMFRTGTAAVDNNDYLIYNKTTGALFYDDNANGAGHAVQIAIIGTTTHPTLTAADFVVI